MTLESAKQNIKGYFTQGSFRCLVAKVETFNGVPHYGFISVRGNDDNWRPYSDEAIAGWIPAIFVGACELTA